jgi:hypothetical protein
MKAKIAFMKSKGQAVYPDANSTLRVTIRCEVAGRDRFSRWSGMVCILTTVNGIPPTEPG